MYCKLACDMNKGQEAGHAAQKELINVNNGESVPAAIVQHRSDRTTDRRILEFSHKPILTIHARTPVCV